MNKTIKTKLISLFAVLLSICMLFSVASMVTTTAKAEGTTTAATLVEGAAVRVNSAESSGLKFKASIDKAQYNALYNQAGGQLKAGMIIVPTDYITAANGYTFNAFAAAGKTVASNTIAEFKNASESTYEFTMSIINLKLANYDRDFEAIVYLESEVALDGFVAYGDKYYAYAERNEAYARNIYEVAKGVYNDRADVQDETKYIYEVNGKFATLDTDGLAIAKTFIDGVTEIVLDNGKPAAYSSEYYAAKDSILTNDTEAYLLGEHKNVVYKGESISSYPFTADGIAIKEMYTNGATYADGAYTVTGLGGLIVGANINNFGAVTSNATNGHIAFDGEYGPSTYVEFTFTGNNLPNVVLFSNNVANGNFTYQGGRGLAFLNGFTTDNGTTGSLKDIWVYGPKRMSGHANGNFAATRINTSGAPTMNYLIANSTTEFRYVVGTYIVKEDVHNASGVIYAAEEEKDGVLENVVYYDFYLYNNATGAEIVHKTDRLKPAYVNYIKDYVATANTEYLLAEDFVDGGIMAFPAFKGVDAEDNVVNSTFKVTKAPYHVHNYGSEIKSDATHHWNVCALCGAAGEKVEHTGGTATHTEKAECEVCGTAYGDFKPAWKVDDVELLNLINVSAPEVISATKGSITATANAGETAISTGKAGTIVVADDGASFIMVGFNAVADGNTSTYARDAMLLNVGVRGLATDNAYKNWTLTFWGNANGAYLFKDYNTRGNYGAYTTQGSTAWESVTAGTQYYILTGVVGTGDDAVLHWYWLDANRNILRGLTASIAQIRTQTGSATWTIADSGFFTIHNYSTEERTISWEVMGVEQAMYYANGGKGVEGLAVSGNTASWTAYNGATSYKVKVDNGEWTDVGNVTSYAIPNLTAFDTYSVAVKAVCAGFETKETATQFTYVPSGITLVNVDSIKADGNATATSGKVTVTADTASAIGFAADATDFIKVKFAATGAAVEAMSINFRQASVTASLYSAWGIIPNPTHGMMLNYGGNNYMNRINGNGLYTSVIGGNNIEANSDFTEGNEYAYMVGITGTGTDKVLHFMIIDETNAVIMRYVTWTWAQISEYRDKAFSGWTLVDIAESGSFVFNFTGAVNDMTISYEIIEAADVFKNANYGAIANVAANGSTVSWDAVAGATNYLVSVNGGAYETVNTNSYTIANPVSFANYEVEIKANLGYYAATGSVNFVYTPAGISVLNMTEASTANGLSTTSGDITFKATNLSSDFKNTATVVVDGNFTNQFIKVKFTALESGTGRTYMPSQTLGLGIGVRGVSTDNMYNNLAFVPYSNTNWAALFGGGFYLKHSGGIGTGVTAKHWDNIVKGNEYYMVTGVVGSDYNASTETTEDDLVFYWMLLDADNSLRVSKIITAAEIQAVRAISIANSGAFTIHSINTTESRTISYEIIDSATALGYLG